MQAVIDRERLHVPLTTVASRKFHPASIELTANLIVKCISTLPPIRLLLAFLPRGAHGGLR